MDFGLQISGVHKILLFLYPVKFRVFTMNLDLKPEKIPLIVEVIVSTLYNVIKYLSHFCVMRLCYSQKFYKLG